MGDDRNERKRWSWNALVDHLSPSMMIAVLRPDGTLVHANETALRWVGTKEVSAVGFGGTPWIERSQVARERFPAALAAALRGESSRFEYPLPAVSGETRVVDFSLRPVLDDSGRPALLVVSACDITNQHRAEEHALRLAYHDRLTGLLTLHGLSRTLDGREGSSGRASPAVALLINLDRFSRINRAVGRGAGDQVLKTLATRMQACLPAPMQLVRLDGDEFGVVLWGSNASLPTAVAVAGDLLASMARPLCIGDHEWCVTASIGIGQGACGPTGLEELLRDAAVAMEQAKTQGRNTWVVHQRKRDHESDRSGLETALRHAIRRNELRLLYQPQVALSTGEIVGVEALLRWEHPVHGTVSPAQFIPVAEEAGLIGVIGDWVLHKACTVAREWQRQGLPPVRMKVNVSAFQLLAGGFAARIEAVLADTGLEPRRLGIEVTEALFMQHLDDASAQLVRLRGLGVEISLDNFGTGYSSLGCLRRLPLDAVKIDRSLVPARSGDADALPIVRAIIAMAHSLGMKVVAEGVENEAQLELLTASHCDEFQGYHFSRPVDADTLYAMLHAGRRLPTSERRRSARLRTVAVVDDDPRVLDMLAQQLRLHFPDRLHVETFSSPHAALQCLRKEAVDVLVSDLQMPGMDGISLLSEVATIQPGTIRMVLLGADDLVRVVSDERQVDVFRYLVKPWHPGQMLRHFKAALDRVDRDRAEARLTAASPPRSSGADTAWGLLQLEDMEPGLTAVERGPLGEVLLPLEVVTQPADLWVMPAAHRGGAPTATAPSWRAGDTVPGALK